MRITEAKIRQVIREEIKNTLSEAGNFVYYPEEELQSDEFADRYKPKPDPTLIKKSFFPSEDKEALATFKVKDILNIFATPKSDAAVDKLKPLSVFIFNFKNYANQLTPDQRQLLFKEDAKIIKKGSGNMYRYYLVVPHLTEEGFKETVIGGETELSMFEDISGIKVNKPIVSKPFKPAPFKAGVPVGLQGLKEAIRRIILKELRKR